MHSRVLVGVQHEDHRLAALWLERCRGETAQLRHRLGGVQVRRNRRQRCELAQQFPESACRLKFAAAERGFARPSPGCETSAERFGPGAGTTPPRVDKTAGCRNK